MNTQPIISTPSHDVKESTIALMLEHMRGQLSQEIHEKVSRAITKCESCRQIYNTITDLYDSSANVLYEIKNKKEVERTDRLFDDLFNLYAPEGETQENNTLQENNPSYAFEFEENCLGCSS